MFLTKKLLPTSLINKNFEKGRGKEHPEFIVIHIVGLPGITAQTAYQTFLNPSMEKSAHYVVLKTGEIWQFVDESDCAYGNGIVYNPSNKLIKEKYLKGVSINKVSISIEHEGSEYQDATEAQYKATAELVQGISQRWAIPLTADYVVPHNSIRRDKVCPGKISVGRILSLANAPIVVQPNIPTPNLMQNTEKVGQPPQPTTLLPQWMRFLLDRQALGVARSGDWPTFRKHFLEGKTCAVCGTDKKLEAHHIQSLHLHGTARELDETNLIALCRVHHLWHGHLGSFYSENSSVADDAKAWNKKINERP